MCERASLLRTLHQTPRLVTESVWLVLAGGAIGIVSSVVPLLLKRIWERADRRRASDRAALESAVRKLMAWQDFAVRSLGSGDTAAAEKRLRELDTEWEADFGLLPDQEATRAILSLSKEIFFFGGLHRDSPDAMEKQSRLMTLLDRALLSAQRKRRELA